MAFLQIEREDGIVVATMNQPETRNALTGNTAIEEIVQLCADIRQDAGAKVLILTAAGPIFSSGGNVKDMRRFFDDALTPERICEEYRQGIQRIPLALHGLDVPVICAVNGPAIGAGLDIACMCDIRIAADTATFAESFVRVGIVPGDGGAWLLPRAVGMARASEMAYTGEAISAQDALAWGLVSRVVPAAELLPAAKTLAAKIAANPGGVMRMTKRLLREGQHSSLASLLELSASYQALAHKTAEHREAVTAFIEKRAPRF
ncbi:crotonase/enoyl-CoA hydratase family protein [Achromobacter anxifer]